MKKIFIYAITAIIATILVLFCTACAGNSDKTIGTSDISQGTSITTTTTKVDSTTTTTTRASSALNEESKIKTLEVETMEFIVNTSTYVLNTTTLSKNSDETHLAELSNIKIESSTTEKNMDSEISETFTITKTSVTTTNSCTTEGSSTTLISVLKSNEEIALEVIRGNWGNGNERKKMLSDAGYDYKTIQKIVNQMINDMHSAATTIATDTTNYTTITTVTETSDSGDFTTTTTENTTLIFTDYEYNLLCKLIASEYGGMNNVVERAKIVAAVVNQTERFGGDIESCIYRSCVPWGFDPSREYYCGVYYKDMSDAIDYYIENGESGFYSSGYWQEDADSWWGDGRYNHFYKA